MTFSPKVIISSLLLALPLFAQAIPIAVSATSGSNVVVVTKQNIVATYQGNTASFTNRLYLVTDDGIANNDVFIFDNKVNRVGDVKDLGNFATGTQLQFRLLVTNTGYNFYSGEASRNPDAHTHARVQDNWLPGSTLVSFEDLYNGRFDFNDLSFSFTDTLSSEAAALLPLPEPGSLVLLGLGLAGLLTAQKRAARVKVK